MTVGDIKLMNVIIVKNGEKLYEGMVEDAPEELRKVQYKTANFESNHIVLKIDWKNKFYIEI